MQFISSLSEAKEFSFLWVWRFLITWGIKHLEIGYYPDYEDVSWQIEFKKFS